MTDELDPLDAETFDIDAWLEDAHLPEESVRVYKRADLLGKITALQEKIKDEHNADDDSLAGSIGLGKLTEQYEALLEEFGASALTIYVSTVPSSKVRNLRQKLDKARDQKIKKGASKDDAAEWHGAELIYSIMAEAIVAVSGPDDERKPVKWSADDLRKLEDRIGTGQFDAIMKAKRDADSKVQEPDADFLHKLSGDSSDDTEG